MDYVAARKITGSFSGMRMSDILAIRRDALGRTEMELPTAPLMAARVRHYLELIPTHVQLMPGARAAMEAAAGSCVVAVVSSEVTPCIQAVLHQFGLEDLVTYVVGGDNVAHGKPAPECYELAHARLQGLAAAAKDECLAVEDSTAGAAAALAAGLPLCFVPSPFDPAPEGLTAHYRLASLTGFPALVQMLQSSESRESARPGDSIH